MERNSKLQWQFSAGIWQDMRQRDGANYVLVDLAELGRLQSSRVIGIYLHARKWRGSGAPQFTVAYEPSLKEEANTRRLLSALRTVSDVLKVVCYVRLEFRQNAPEPERFLVKMTHEEARWKAHSYLKFTRAKVWRVDAKGYRRFEPTAIRDARADLIENEQLGLDQQNCTPP